jgi:hypothetical protein
MKSMRPAEDYTWNENKRDQDSLDEVKTQTVMTKNVGLRKEMY